MSTDTAFSVGPQDRRCSQQKEKLWADGQWSSGGCAQSSHHCLFQPTVIVPHAHWEAYGRGNLPLHNPVSDSTNPDYLSDPPTRKQQQPSRGHQEITATIQRPPGNISNHPEAIRKQQQPSRGHQEITAAIQRPPGNISNHPEPIRKEQQPSRGHQEISATIQSPL